MNFVLKPWQFALFAIAGWVSREQQQVIEYLRTENVVLRLLFVKPLDRGSRGLPEHDISLGAVMDSILPNGQLTWKECDDIGELSTCSVLGRDHGCGVPSFFECRLCRFEQAIVVDVGQNRFQRVRVSCGPNVEDIPKIVSSRSFGRPTSVSNRMSHPASVFTFYAGWRTTKKA